VEPNFVRPEIDQIAAPLQGELGTQFRLTAFQVKRRCDLDRTTATPDTILQCEIAHYLVIRQADLVRGTDLGNEDQRPAQRHSSEDATHFDFSVRAKPQGGVISVHTLLYTRQPVQIAQS
jgi:hypothetical protein